MNRRNVLNACSSTAYKYRIDRRSRTTAKIANGVIRDGPLNWFYLAIYDMDRINEHVIKIVSDLHSVRDVTITDVSFQSVVYLCLPRHCNEGEEDSDDGFLWQKEWFLG